MNVFEKIEKQQHGIENTAPWVVGEQLKEICRREPAAAEIVSQDLDKESMSLKACEKNIKAYADKHKTGNFAFVPPAVAEGIIREFYGITATAATVTAAAAAPKQEAQDGIIDLDDFL